MNSIFIVLCLLVIVNIALSATNDEKSPFFQNLPNCDQPYTKVEKKTKAKAMVCPMIRYYLS